MSNPIETEQNHWREESRPSLAWVCMNVVFYERKWEVGDSPPPSDTRTVMNDRIATFYERRGDVINLDYTSSCFN